MPSRRLAVALVAVVLLSGCSMLPGGGGGGGDQTTTPEPPAHHEFVFGSHTGGEPFEASVTVEKDGSVLHEQTIRSDGNGTYAELARLEEPGPYTVVVNTTLPDPGEGNESVRFQTAGDLGNATAVYLDYQDVRRATFELPRRDLEHELGVKSHYTTVEGSQPRDVRLRVAYRGEAVVSETTTVEGSELTRSVDLAQTGVYNVAARVGDRWVNETVVVATPAQHVAVVVNDHGDAATIRVQRPFQWN